MKEILVIIYSITEILNFIICLIGGFGVVKLVDLHRLFDNYLLAIHPKTREVLISEKIEKNYQDFIGIKIESRLTGEGAAKQQDALRYHCEQCNWIDEKLLE